MFRSILFMAASAAVLGLASTADAQQARDQIRAVGSSTVFPFTTTVAENFARTSGRKAPIVESTGTGGGFRLFCAGVGTQHPDISNASRAITKSELETCAKNGVTSITEVKIGFDGIVLAVPAPAASRLVQPTDAALAAELGGIDYAGSAIVSLGFVREDVAHPLDAAGVVVPRAEGRRILAVSFSSSKFPGRAPDGMVLMRVFVGGALDPDAAQLDAGALESLVLGEVRSLLGVRGRPRLLQIDRWSGAMPQYHLGHLDRLARIDTRLMNLPGLTLAGAAYRGVGIPQVILSGQQAAARL